MSSSTCICHRPSEGCGHRKEDWMQCHVEGQDKRTSAVLTTCLKVVFCPIQAHGISEVLQHLELE
eukprot:scaffold651761_cov46-Prasinocladus_malaysianus.AAC.1